MKPICVVATWSANRENEWQLPIPESDTSLIDCFSSPVRRLTSVCSGELANTANPPARHTRKGGGQRTAFPAGQNPSRFPGGEVVLALLVRRAVIGRNLDKKSNGSYVCL